MGRLAVREVSGRRGLKRFLDVPKRLYPPDSPWVAPLDFERRRFFNPRRNPFFEHAEMALFLATHPERGDVGRIAAIENRRYNEFHGDRTGFFGFFECEENLDTARALLDAVSRWLEARRLRVLHGPVNPSTNHECGLLVEGFDRPPMVEMPYNHPYYEKLLLDCGFEAAKDLVAFLYEVDDSVPERLVRAKELFAKRRGRFALRRINLKRFDEELQRVKLIYNEAWAANFGFVPLTDAEIDYIARDLKPIVDPDLAFFAEVEGEPAGFALALPDVNQALKPLRGRLLPFGWVRLLWGLRRIDALRAMVLGIRPRFRRLGIDYAFYLAGLEGAQRGGYREIEVSWVLADNVALTRPIERFGARLYKRYRLYERPLS